MPLQVASQSGLADPWVACSSCAWASCEGPQSLLHVKQAAAGAQAEAVHQTLFYQVAQVGDQRLMPHAAALTGAGPPAAGQKGQQQSAVNVT